MLAEIKKNVELNGIEVYFQDKPEAEAIDLLKENHFRWHRAKKCWYAKSNEETEAAAEKVTSGTELTTGIATGCVDAPTFNYSGYGFEGINYKEYGHDIVTIAKTIKKELQRLYPGSVWSVASSKYSGGQSLTLALMASNYPAYRTYEELIADSAARHYSIRRINAGYTADIEDWDTAINEEIKSTINYFDKSGQCQVNQYYVDKNVYMTAEVKAMMITARNLANSFNHVNFYYDLAIGSYNKPYTFKQGA